MKGKTNNPAGRPKGVPNKATTALKEWINELVDDNREQLKTDFLALDAKERWLVADKLLSFVLAKQTASTAEINLNGLTENELDAVCSKILNNINHENEGTDETD